MASQEELIQWAMDHADTLDLKVCHYNWTATCLPSFTDISVAITLRENKFTGRATTQSEDLSFAKAFAEAIERSVAIGNHLNTTNAVAAHLDNSTCQENACNELIERDWFLAHFLTQSPFSISNLKILLPREIQKTIERLEKEGIHFTFATSGTNTSPCTFPVACFAFGENFERPFGCFLGLGCSTDHTKAAETATLECFRDLFAFLHRSLHEPINLKEFLQINSYSPDDHRRLGMNLDYAQNLRKLLFQGTQTNPNLAQTHLSESLSIATQKLPIPFSEIDTVPLVVHRAYSAQAQDLFFGPVSNSKINFSRLSSFSGREMTLKDLSILPHPLS